LDGALPWDFIDTGVKKEWLINEHEKALSDAVSPPCDRGCAACGVCQNTKQRKIIYSENSYIAKQKPAERNSSEKYLYRLVISKKGDLKYISHLDWVGTFYKSLKKAGLNLVFSQGFNPAPKISASVALPIFVESDGEVLDIELYDKKTPEELQKQIQKHLPNGSKVLQVKSLDKSEKGIDQKVFWAKYEAEVLDKTLVKSLSLRYKISELSDTKEILIEKTTKKGLQQQINIRPSVKSFDIIDEEKGTVGFVIKTGQAGSDKIKQLRADDFLDVIFPKINWKITRKSLLDENLKELLQDL
jgi:radical SAM-linked protein